MRYEARRVLVAEAGATLVTVAKDVKIQVEFNPSAVVRDRTGQLTPTLGFASAVSEFGMLLRQSEFKGQATWAAARDLARRFRGEDPDGTAPSSCA